MASGDTTAGWYVRARGRVLGPLTWSQLQSLRDRGRLARFDEVSQDRQSWIGADRVPRLFPQVEAPSPRASASASADLAEFIVLDDDNADSTSRTTSTAIEDDFDWYFAVDKTQHGPVRLWQLQRMADAGEIGPETLVWRNGFEQWTPGSQVEALNFPVRLDAIASAPDDARSSQAVGVTLPPRQGGDTPNPANPRSRTSILAINSLITGCLWLFGIGSLAAIVFGVMAMRQIARSQGTLTGKRLAIAGIIVGTAGLGLTLGLLILRGSPP
jgi:GYF domain 2/Domain of unknown function (DUF4190)